MKNSQIASVSKYRNGFQIATSLNVLNRHSFKQYNLNLESIENTTDEMQWFHLHL